MMTSTKAQPTERSPSTRTSQPYGAIKRLLDITIASLTLVGLLPLLLLISICIALDSRGPILYSQQRVGMDRRRDPSPSRKGGERRRHPGYGRPFRIHKFRSMVVNAERETGPVWTVAGDPRVTRVGGWLRRTHLDELPQLLNVLRGEMSLVGPRPERPEFVERLSGKIPRYEERCHALPGITGLAQVEYTYDRSLETVARKLQYDLYYVRNGGLLLDLKIMAATLLVMARASDQD